MYCDRPPFTMEEIDGWSITADFSVGGFEYLGFPKSQTNKLLCISSNYFAIIDCDTGEKCIVEGCYDESNPDQPFALCDAYPDEPIEIVSHWDGKMNLNSGKGESVSITSTTETDISSITGRPLSHPVVRWTVYFNQPLESAKINDDYGFYLCSFSPCGNYFVFAQDSGVTILKRCT